MFPAIKQALREIREGFGYEPIALDIERKDGIVVQTGDPNWWQREGFRKLQEARGDYSPSYSGKTITEQTALNIAAVWRCVQVIAQAESWLPLHLMERGRSGDTVAYDHPLDWVLYRRPNPEMTSLRMRHTMMAHLLTWGNAYAQIVRRSGTGKVIELRPVTPDRVTPVRTPSGERVYVIADGFGRKQEFPSSEIFHIPGFSFDGLVGYSVVSMARQTLGLASVQDEYAGKFFARGGRRPYILRKAVLPKSDQEADAFRAKWNLRYSNSDGFSEPIILTGEAELQELGLPFDDMQLLESRQFSVTEICRWFGVPPHKAFDLDRSTNNNIEHQGREFLQDSLMHWLSLWEQEAETQLLTPSEQGRFYIKHNVNALQRPEFETRMRGYATGTQNGWLNPDDVRALEDMPPLPNGAGQAYHIQSNMQTLPPEGQPLAWEQGVLNKITEQNGGRDGNQAA